MSTLQRGGLALAALEEQLLQPGVKGLPITAPLRQGAIGVQGWNVLRADTSFPVAVLKTSALRHNLEWMRAFCDRYGATLAPHGKTTMSPQLFGAQLANGAWGITLATATQVQVAHRFGVRRVLLANQLVAKADINSVLHCMHDDPDFEMLRAGRFARRRGAAWRRGRRAPAGARRCRCWSNWAFRASAPAAAARMKRWRWRGPSPARRACNWPASKATKACWSRTTARPTCTRSTPSSAQHGRSWRATPMREGLFGGAEILLSAGGSAYFDLVARGFDGVQRPVAPGARGAAQRLLPDQRPRLLPAPDRRAGRARSARQRRPAAGAGSVEHGAVAPGAGAGDPHDGQARRLLRRRPADAAVMRTVPGPACRPRCRPAAASSR